VYTSGSAKRRHRPATVALYCAVQKDLPEWMSPTKATVPTLRSALIASMNAGVRATCEVSVGVRPYGESPKTARVALSESAAGERRPDGR
jgi:hypothetical protein